MSQSKILREKNDELQHELRTESLLKEKAELSVIAFKNRARTFWERCRWELEKRREPMVNFQSKVQTNATSKITVQEIEPSMLCDPVVNGKKEARYVGRGCFGVVRVQLLRGMLVAVKQYLPRTVKNDVLQEASILSKICHPYLPLLLGVCTKQQPLCLVMQFHAFVGLESRTMDMEL